MSKSYGMVVKEHQGFPINAVIEIYQKRVSDSGQYEDDPRRIVKIVKSLDNNLDYGMLHTCDNTFLELNGYFIPDGCIRKLTEEEFDSLITASLYVDKYIRVTNRRNHLDKGTICYVKTIRKCMRGVVETPGIVCSSYGQDLTVIPQHVDKSIGSPFNNALMHTCNGHVKDDNGYWVGVDQIELIVDPSVRAQCVTLDKEADNENNIEEDFGIVW